MAGFILLPGISRGDRDKNMFILISFERMVEEVGAVLSSLVIYTCFSFLSPHRNGMNGGISGLSGYDPVPAPLYL